VNLVREGDATIAFECPSGTVALEHQRALLIGEPHMDDLGNGWYANVRPMEIGDEHPVYAFDRARRLWLLADVVLAKRA
jgi:hypothetical protein